MAVRTFAVASFTTEAKADAVAFTDGAYMALQGGSSTQRTEIVEVELGGQEPTTSSPQVLLLALDGTVGATPTALSTGESDQADDPATAALAAPAVSFTGASTKPQRAKKYLANLSFNALGGKAIKRFPEKRPPTILGASANGGEVSLSGFTGTTPGKIGAHIKYETL